MSEEVKTTPTPKKVHVIEQKSILHESRLLRAYSGIDEARIALCKTLFFDADGEYTNIVSTDGRALCKVRVKTELVSGITGNWKAQEFGGNKLLLIECEREYPNYKLILPDMTKYHKIYNDKLTSIIPSFVGVNGVKMDYKLIIPLEKYLSVISFGDVDKRPYLEIWGSNENPDITPFLIKTENGKVEVLISPSRY